MRVVAPLELSGWTEIFLEMNFSGTFMSISKIYLLHSNYEIFFRVSSHLKTKTHQKCVIYEDKPKTRQERIIQLHNIQYKKHACTETDAK